MTHKRRRNRASDVPLLPEAPKPVAPHSHAVEAGGFVFVTVVIGLIAVRP